MNSKKFEESVDKKFSDCKNLLFSKAKEYASDEDRLCAFKMAATLEKTSPEDALGGMLAKHIVSIFEMLKEPQKYGLNKWDEKINDAINYLLLLNALLQERGEQDEKY